MTEFFQGTIVQIYPIVSSFPKILLAEYKNKTKQVTLSN